MESSHRAVVVAVGPDGSTAAVQFAAAEATRTGRGLHLVHGTGPESADARANLRRDADAARLVELVAAEAARLVGPQLSVTTAVVRATPAAAVAEAGAGTPLVVMARRSRAPHAHPQLRSATEDIAAHVRVPVVAVPDSWTRPASEPLVVVGTDPIEPAQDVLAQGFEAARERGGRLLLLASWWRPVGADRHTTLGRFDGTRGTELLPEQVEEAIMPFRAWYGEVPVEVVVSASAAAEALVSVSDDADLLVLGRREPWLASGSRVGPVARRVLHEATCPVLLAGVGERRHRPSHARGA